jgi:hypothetical protein
LEELGDVAAGSVWEISRRFIRAWVLATQIAADQLGKGFGIPAPEFHAASSPAVVGAGSS